MQLTYLFCTDELKDKVGPLAWQVARELIPMTPAGFAADGGDVMKVEDRAGNEIFLVPTLEIVSHNLRRYQPLLSGFLGASALAGIVNWHEGGNAPDHIFCVHTNGDVPSGCFPKAQPHLTSQLLRSLDKEARLKGLVDWRALPEATHFSGVVYGTKPSALLDLPVPLVDVEIGSNPCSWSDRVAAEALVLALWRAFECEEALLPVVLFVGGMHFDAALAEGVVGNGGAGPSCSFGHVLPNQWVVNEGYLGADGMDKLRAAVSSLTVKPDILVYHDNLKGPFKSAVRALASELSIPAANHRILRRGVQSIRRGA